MLHEILFQDIGIAGIAYNWFKSFLINRTQKVKIGNSYSEETQLPYGVAQGSVLGPPLFNIYCRSLYKYVESTKFHIEGYADDHQLMKKFLPALQRYALGDNIKNCLQCILQWMNEHFLCLNQNKTKILVIAPPAVKNEIVIGGMFLDNKCIRFVDSAKNLGFILDIGLSFETQINKVVKSCFMAIRKLSSIKNVLTKEQLKSLVCSFVFSQIDYCNSLYYGLNSSLLKKLQYVQNCAARLVMKGNIQTSLNSIFLDFHWLKVRERILFKTLLIVFKCLHQTAPESVCRLLNYAECDRLMKLRENKVNSKYGDRAFSRAGPKLWNLLPHDIRNQHNVEIFKKMLKTYLLTKGDEFYFKINIH